MIDWLINCSGNNNVFKSISDYDAPLSENGGYTLKYDKTAEMIAGYDTLAAELFIPERPEHIPPVTYVDAQVTEMLTFQQILDNVVSH